MSEKIPNNLEDAEKEVSEMQEKIQTGEAEDYAEAEKLVDEKKEEKEIILTPEQEKARQELINLFPKNYTPSVAREIIDKFSLPNKIIFSQEVQQAAKEGLINYLLSDAYLYAFRIKDRFFPPEEVENIISSPEVRQAVKEGVINHLSECYVDPAISIKDEFSLPEEMVQQAAKEGLIKCLSKSRTNHYYIESAIEIKEIKDKFSLSAEMVQQAAKEGLSHRLSKCYIEFATEIKDEFSLPEEMVQQAAKEGFVNLLSEGRIDSAIRIKEEFSVNITNEEIIKEILEINNLLSELQQVSPEFYEQAHKSFDILISLFAFRENQEKLLGLAKENPFLLDAVSENPKFGSKLLIKYPQFDELSKENIKLLFDAKKEILESNPEMDPESLEFRQAMQDKLAEYGENPEIAEAIKEQGIDLDKWLNYSDTQYFSLESGKSVLAFSETIASPIERIKETIDSYSYTIKDVLKEYRKELSEFQIPIEDPKEIEEKIAKMTEAMEQAKNEGNEGKAQGIAKGIEGLTAKLEKLKTVSLWNKLLGDIAAFGQLKNDVFEAQENLVKTESEFHESVSGKSLSGREIQKLKQKMAIKKEELRSKFGVMERRIEDFRNNLPSLVSSALGEDRTTALTQEIQEKTSEQFDHYDTDRSALANLFSEKTDKEKERMESQPMSIFVWARNPDIDLYQGNYSDCCIRIDSAHMGAESTIADYNTDLGIQIVNIWDETKNEPITAAWCWLGKDEKGESALVVDNIESNTLYSSNYPEQLKNELFKYLEKYAQSIGAKKVVLGKANNDLPASSELNKMKDDEAVYDKIGGHNRADGYFLEAEDKKVKLIWESKEKQKVEKKKEKIKKIRFQNLKTENITENDFSALLDVEKKIYTREDPELIQGQAMIEDIREGNGLEYSVALSGKREGKKEIEMIGYIAAIDDETDEGEPSVYLEDIAVLPEAQGQDLGWKMMKKFVEKLKAKAKKDNKPILLDMHLRENSQAFMEKHKENLERLGVKLVEEALVADYYDEGEGALYQLYEIKFSE